MNLGYSRLVEYPFFSHLILTAELHFFFTRRTARQSPVNRGIYLFEKMSDESVNIYISARYIDSVLNYFQFFSHLPAFH